MFSSTLSESIMHFSTGLFYSFSLKLYDVYTSSNIQTLDSMFSRLSNFIIFGIFRNFAISTRI